MMTGRSTSSRPPPAVTFVLRTSSGRCMDYSRKDNSAEVSSAECNAYTVHIPPTPDNRPISAAEAGVRAEEHYVSSSLFTGGFKSVTRAHHIEIATTADAGKRSSTTCAVAGCDDKPMPVLPCECDFRICSECYVDAVKVAGGTCPGCKEVYRTVEELLVQMGRGPLSLPAPEGGEKMEGTVTMGESHNSVLMKSQTGDQWDHISRWLFETKGTYGYGNAFWVKEGGDEKVGGGGGGRSEAKVLLEKPWRPLTRKVKVPASILSPYRCGNKI